MKNIKIDLFEKFKEYANKKKRMQLKSVKKFLYIYADPNILLMYIYILYIFLFQ